MVQAFDFEWDYPYGVEDYVVFRDQLYQCASYRGFCGFFPADIDASTWNNFKLIEFEIEDKFG